MDRPLHPFVRLTISSLAMALFVTGGLFSTAAQTPPARTRAAVSRPVDVNSADAKTLETLPGIGPVLAQRIVDNRPYRNLADLEKVKGLGQAKVAAFKEAVVFGPSPTHAKPSSAGTNILAKKDAASSPAPASLALVPPAQRTPVSRSASDGSPKLRQGEKININKATAAQLERLPGIGPAKSKAIIEFRAQNGDFKTIEGIQQVKGIKGGVFSRVKDYIKVTD